MKKFLIKYIPVFLVLSMLSSSCSEDFLNVSDPNRLAVTSFYQSPDDALYAVNTAYNGLQFGGMFGMDYFFLFNSFSDRILFETTGMDNFIIGSNDGRVGSMYQALYVGLYRCSRIIMELNSTSIPNLDENLKANYIAQLKGLRAMYYFYLVTIFDRPVFYDENSLPEDPATRFRNADQIMFWDKIVQDCTDAMDVLPASWDDANLGRITSGAVKSLLGKAMLYKHYYYHERFGTGGSDEDIKDLNMARDMFNEVMSSGTYQLIEPMAPKSREDYINAFLCNFSYIDLPAGDNLYPSENNAEAVWQVQYSDSRIQDGWLPGWQWTGQLDFHYFSAHPSSFRNHEIHPDMWYQWETAGAPAGFDRDPRAYATCYLDGDPLDFREGHLYYNVPYVSGTNNKKIGANRGLDHPGQPSVGFGLKKYYYPTYDEKDSPNNAPFNITLIRYSDVLLMYAEVQFLIGDDGTGLTALNKVRERAGMPDIAALTRESIMHERDVELATEGFRFFDLVRWSFDPAWNIDWFQIFKKSVFTVGKNEFLPIPVSEINLNQGMLKQNPGW
ncbi:MAG TPA: RagB/SusD family nutrient uptake outer membrane protein [Bacteroidales bacterium]|nr:RagB/SusD family nutrient uptake outer membrane protein [Bacteroidales bacterium]